MKTPGIPGEAATNHDEGQDVVGKKERVTTPWLEQIQEEASKAENPVTFLLGKLEETEKRRRDNAGGFHKANAEATRYKAQSEVLSQELQRYVTPVISKEEQDELDDLLVTSPEEWRKKMNSLEAKSRNAIQEQLSKVASEAGDKATAQTELERREEILKHFLEANPGLVINDEVINDEIPPRITKKLAKNEISFEEFLVEVAEYLKADKKVQGSKIEDLTTLNKAAGSTTPNLSKKDHSAAVGKDWKDTLL